MNRHYSATILIIMPRRSKSDELLDFEIAFYEKLLAAYPDFADVLIPLGEAYTRRGLHEKGLQVDLRLAQLRGNDPLTWYNLACSYALLRRIEEALDALHHAATLGYHDVSYLQKDPDLESIRHSPKYRALLDTMAASAIRAPSVSQRAPGQSGLPSA